MHITNIKIKAAIKWDHNWEGRQVVEHCENIHTYVAVVTALNNKRCKNKCYADAENTIFIKVLSSISSSEAKVFQFSQHCRTENDQQPFMLMLKLLMNAIKVLSRV